ncbi:hypothetical protein HY637_00020 [Candidatus Woesearchaeota archaeon]|nr:hypothetical protein [Candidatus Pacearchaeota archaeon]MBI4451789.1 hypothetical protein [Candidatus Woesearchaeota archaeon]
MVCKLVAKHKKEGSEAYKAKKAGKPKTSINPSFVKKVAEVRKSTGYGSEKIHFVLKKSG